MESLVASENRAVPKYGPEELTRWERRMEFPLMVGALVFLAAYALPILMPERPRWLTLLGLAASAASWVLFLIDFMVRVGLAPDRRQYLRRHWPDLLVLALPLLRPLRLLRLLVVLNVLHRRVGGRVRGRIVVYVVVGSLLLAFCAALAELDAERGARGANIETFGDSFWWAMTTMTTVGYGDHYPVTAIGRCVAVTLMIGGVAMLGVVTATLASWLVEAVQNERQETVDLQAEVRALHAKLDLLLGSGAGDSEPDPR
jgi:voltage-gated potassium channel